MVQFSSDSSAAMNTIGCTTAVFSVTVTLVAGLSPLSKAFGACGYVISRHAWSDLLATDPPVLNCR